MVKGTGMKARHSRNLLQAMDAAMGNDGPLKWLESCRVQHIRIKVNGYYSITSIDRIFIWKWFFYCRFDCEMNQR